MSPATKGKNFCGVNKRKNSKPSITEAVFNGINGMPSINNKIRKMECHQLDQRSEK